jgi:ribosomal protein S18 acetylase RimI-like enzyme
LHAHEELDAEPLNYRIRDCTYGELNQVADVIIAAFYSNSTNPWRQLYRMGELNRVQQAYPYKKSDHRMFVALVQTENALRDEKIVAFVDVDDRPVPPRFPSPYKHNPRPYLSDLCVHPDFHRKGIARSMVEQCEKFCREDLQKNELFIRVEQSNQPALLMYQSMGYTTMDDPDNGPIILLRKSLMENVSEMSHQKEDRLVEQQAEMHT